MTAATAAPGRQRRVRGPVLGTDGSTAFSLLVDVDRMDGGPLARAPGRRAHLQLVPSHPAGVAGRAQPVQLTRVGRLLRAAVLGAVVLVALALGVGGLRAVAAGGDHHVTVQAGQTMWQIAAEQLPGLPTPEGVARIQLANGLSSAEVHAGQVLAIP